MVSEAILEEESIARERSIEEPDSRLLEQPIRTLPNLRAPLCLAPTTSLAATIGAMRSARTGCVLVVTEGRLCGIFTEHDVLARIVGEPLDLNAHTLREFMTPDPETLTADDAIVWALNKMAVGGFRHVPLVDERGRATGIVAMPNVVEHLADLHPKAVLMLPPSPPRGIPGAREGA